MHTLIQGRIVWAEVLDPQGRNAKERPLVVLTDHPKTLSDDHELLTVAITSQSSQADSEHCTALPWSRNPGCITKLNSPSVAVCSWTCVVKKGAIQKIGGLVPPHVMQQILAKIKAIKSEGGGS
jgi:mRNA-degrading endonuclease toxin of MazEF toxin-antitoxin module